MTYLSILSCLLLYPTSIIVHSFDLTLLHTNDVHARIEQANKYGGKCSQREAAADLCYGGFARLKTKVVELRTSYPNSLLLDAGDQYSGTLWFYKFGGEGIAAFMNLLGYDAMALGNHEFDRGSTGLLPFLDRINCTMLSANINAESDPQLHGKFQKSIILTVDEERLEIIGYTTFPGPLLLFEDEVTAVQQEVTSLQEQGVNKIIAVGHSGFDIDKHIAERVRVVDIVIGGHDNTFLYTGDQPSNEEPEGEYPHVVTKGDGTKVLVVQDYKYGKYLGELHVTFDNEGGVTSWHGNPILLDKNTAQDAATETLLEPYKQQLEADMAEVIGQSYVRLVGEREVCRQRECNMGNLVTDSMVRYSPRNSDSSWNNLSIAILNGGGILGSI